MASNPSGGVLQVNAGSLVLDVAPWDLAGGSHYRSLGGQPGAVDAVDHYQYVSNENTRMMARPFRVRGSA
eukprot:11289679-Alexandrium_andersonii.AAC.1